MNDHTPEYRLVPVGDVRVPDHRRRQPRRVEALAEAIRLAGRLIQPIVVTESLVLAAGARRLAACRLLGWEFVEAKVVAMDPLEAELVEIDENLERDELTVLERAEHLARRKEIYEARHPQTKQGVAGGKARQGSANEIISFAEDAAAKTGTTPRTIQQEVKIATDIPDEVRDAIRDTPVADSKTELLALARLPGDEQAAVAGRIASGEASGVREAVARPAAPRPKKKPAQEEVCDALGRRVPPTLRDVFADEAVPAQAKRCREWMDAVKYDSVAQALTRRGRFYPFVDAAKVRATLEEAWDLLRAAAEMIELNLPHAVCPSCGGAGRADGEGCHGCRGGGHVPAWRHRELLAEGFREEPS